MCVKSPVCYHGKREYRKHEHEEGADMLLQAPVWSCFLLLPVKIIACRSKSSEEFPVKQDIFRIRCDMSLLLYTLRGVIHFNHRLCLPSHAWHLMKVKLLYFNCCKNLYLILYKKSWRPDEDNQPSLCDSVLSCNCATPVGIHLVDLVQYEASLWRSIASVVSLSNIVMGSLRGICVPQRGLVQRVPFIRNTGRWLLDAASQVDHNQPFRANPVSFIYAPITLIGKFFQKHPIW